MIQHFNSGKHFFQVCSHKFTEINSVTALLETEKQKLSGNAAVPPRGMLQYIESEKCDMETEMLKLKTSPVFTSVEKRNCKNGAESLRKILLIIRTVA